MNKSVIKYAVSQKLVVENVIKNVVSYHLGFEIVRIYVVFCHMGLENVIKHMLFVHFDAKKCILPQRAQPGRRNLPIFPLFLIQGFQFSLKNS